MTISISSLLAFALAMFILAATPGPACFALTARSLTSGTIAGFGVVVGVGIADLIYFILALIGMTKLSEAVGSAFIMVKLAGGAYLIWLGIQMWNTKPVQDFSIASANSSRQFLDNVIEGLIVNLTNPKAIIFYAALLPTFIHLPDIGVIDALVLIAIIFLVGSTIDFAYVLLAARLRKWMTSERSQRLLNRIGGTTLIGVGTVVAIR